MVIFLAENVGTLLRGTSAATSLMDHYMKMVAVPYVQITLRDVVVRIMECKHSWEVRALGLSLYVTSSHEKIHNVHNYTHDMIVYYC